MVNVDLQVVAVAQQMTRRHQRGTVAMLNDLITITTPRTPYKRGTLRGRRRVVPTPNGAVAIWSAPYAAVQERGQHRGARPFTKYTTPGTGSGFVRAGMVAVKSNLGKYFR